MSNQYSNKVTNIIDTLNGMHQKGNLSAFDNYNQN